MKRTIATAAVALALFSGAASAMTASSIETSTIRGYAPNADISQLSHQQVRTLLNVIHGGSSEGEKRAHVRALLNKAG